MNPLHDALAAFIAGWGPGSHVGGWLWPIIPLLWLVAIGLIVWLGARRRPTTPDPMDRARQILAERYARGDLTADEYRERQDNLG
jgi:putative membrane protein